MTSRTHASATRPVFHIRELLAAVSAFAMVLAIARLSSPFEQSGDVLFGLLGTLFVAGAIGRVISGQQAGWYFGCTMATTLGIPGALVGAAVGAGAFRPVGVSAGLAVGAVVGAFVGGLMVRDCAMRGPPTSAE